MNNDSDATCPKCHAPIPEGAPRGLCPRCLMDGVMASEPRPASNTPTLTVEELAPVFPQFKIIELLGSGAMGMVYKAHQPHLDRFVALKILSPELAGDPMFSERFAREARALARLNHPNIVQCFDYGQSEPREDGECYFFLVLEFVDGVNLRQTMHTGALTAREALGIVPRLCDALHYAHEQGVLHRDIKPENILIDKQGRVKIADFGLARFQKGDDAKAMTLTASGAQLGTAAYMAPEQIEQPHEVDHRADIYSLGVVFYEMLTGGLPLGRFAAPSETNGVDPRLDTVVFRTLEKQADRRYQSAGEVRTQVEDIVGTPTPKHKAAAFSTPHSPPSPTSLLEAPAVAFPPSWTAAKSWFWRQPFLWAYGQLTLEPDRLIYASSKATLTIPLDAIEKLSFAPLPFAIEPFGRCPIAVGWRDAAGVAQSTHLLLHPLSLKRPLLDEQRAVDNWMQVMREAIQKATGKEPTCDHDAQLGSADLLPPPPKWSNAVWGVILGILILIAGLLFVGGIDRMDSRSELLGLALLVQGVALGVATGAVAFGLWRRRQVVAEPPESEEQVDADADAQEGRVGRGAKRMRDWVVERRKTVVSRAQAFSSASSKEDAVPSGADGPRWSPLAIVAFLLATFGWAAFMIGPVVGCVLGWVALSQIKRADGALKGRALALFAAVQAPIVVMIAILAGASFLLWDYGRMPLDFPVGIAIGLAILALVGIVFLGVRILFWFAGVKGLWKWRRKAGVVAMLIGTLFVVGSTWVLKDGQTRWPFRGSLVRASAYHDTINRHTIVTALRGGSYGKHIHVLPYSGDADETYLFTVMDDKYEAVKLLEHVGDELRAIEPGTNVRVFPNASLDGIKPSRGSDAEVLFVGLIAICCGAGMLFAFSGFASGGVGLLLNVLVCITLLQTSVPFPIGLPVQELGTVDTSVPFTNGANGLPELSNDDAF